ncbi:MAG TPA: hypothetical protein VHH90_05765 [Polyangia bacterium]|nr:hypothetical protein [Polyangia bacterium]
MDQNRKPGVAPTKDISDLKARLGLKAPAAAPGAPAPGAPLPPSARPPAGGAPFPPQARPAAPQPNAANRPTPAPGTPVVGAPPPAGMNPYANMKAPQGGFDLRSIDDGAPVQNVRSGRGKAVLIASMVVGIGGFALGAGMGIASVGRANMNTANHAAKAVKTELENMQKTLSQIGTAVARSQQRLAAAKKEAVAYDPQFVADLKGIKLDPRPNTATIFRVDFYRLPDADVDKLFNYYYDTIALYNEVERHIRRSENDADALKSYAEKSAGSTTKNYGVVFDNGGKILVANLVEVGDQVCKNGGKDCGADNLVGFKIRSGSGAPWVDRKTGNKPDASILVPLKPTPFMDAVMTGSPDQARQESYKQRVANIRTLLAQITATGKDLMEGINKDAARPDMFAPL